MKKILTLIFILLTFISCSDNSEKVASNFMKEIKNLKIEDSKKYLVNPEIFDNINFENQNNAQSIFFNALFQNLEYSILNSTTREDNTEVINIKITNIDIEKVFSIVYKKIFKKTFSGEKDVKVEDVIVEVLSREDVPKKTVITQLLINKVDKKNKILLRRENIDDIFGSYFSALTNINSEI